MRTDDQDRRDTRGMLDAFSETGTEGILWALHDPGLPGYDGLRILQDGDRLQVLVDDGTTFWAGIVDLDREACMVEGPGGGQSVLGLRVHGVQRGVDPAVSAKMFLDGRRAVLRPRAGSGSAGDAHPFGGSLDDLPQRLAVLPDDMARRMFAAAIYPWLVFYSNGEWTGIARQWGMEDLQDTLALLGHPSPEQVEEWARYPKRSGDRLLPYASDTLLRLAVLFRLHAALSWALPSKRARASWLLSPQPSLGGEIPDRLLRLGTTEALWRTARAAEAAAVL